MHSILHQEKGQETRTNTLLIPVKCTGPFSMKVAYVTLPFVDLWLYLYPHISMYSVAFVPLLVLLLCSR